MTTLRCWLACCLWLLQQLAFAQQDTAVNRAYTDHKPQYRTWQNSYILDKIEYTKTRTILYFRFMCEADPVSAALGGGTDAVFYPPKHPLVWVLVSKDEPKKIYPALELRNVRRNCKLEKKRVDSEFRSAAFLEANTMFDCEIHFERLPDDVQVVDLVEGLGKENNERHFNCFNIKIKPWDSPELGTIKDSEGAIDIFCKQYNLKNPSKPK